MQLNVCFGNLCSPVQAEENWTWGQTTKYLQDHIISDGTLIRGADGELPSYEIVRPGLLAEKWTPEMDMSLGQAATQNEKEQEFDFVGTRNGPFQLYLYPRGALIAIVEDAITHTMEWITFENPAAVAETVNGFLTQIDQTVKNRRASLLTYTKPPIGVRGRLRSLVRRLKHDVYELDPANRSLFERWRAGLYDDPQFMPVVTVRSRLSLPLLDKLRNPALRKIVLFSGSFALVGYIVISVPELGENIMEQVESGTESVARFLEDYY